MRSFGTLTRRNRLALVAGLSVFLVLAGTGVATATWTSAASTTGSVTAATTSLTIVGAPSLTTTYAFAGTAAQSPTIVRTMVVTNTGTAPLNYSLAVGGVAGNTLAPLVTLRLWTITGTCSTLADLAATTGTLAAPPPLPSGALSASPGGSYTLCVATSLNSTIFASQGLSVTPTITITGAVGSNWTTRVADATFTQSVYQMSNPTWLPCVQNKNSVDLSWSAPINAVSGAIVTYRIVDLTSGIVVVASQTGRTATISAMTGLTGNLSLKAEENLNGSISSGISTLVLVRGNDVNCP